jgi:large subunit ribosomal protein L31
MLIKGADFFEFYFLILIYNGIFAPLLGEYITMKKDLHPKNYRLVVFKDMSNDYSFLTKSCIDTRESVKWEDGNEYPLVKLEISHTSHPFYTGKMKLVDTAGRIDKFRTRYNKK